MQLEFTTRRLRSEDFADYDVFLRAGLRAHPDTLRISEADLDAAPFETQPTGESVTLAAVRVDGAWLGVTTLERERGRSKRRHIAWILRMYVSATNAGAGIGRALLRAAISEAGSMPGIAKLNLTVAAHNERAIRLYTSEGFRPFGREEDAFRDPTPRAELSMTLAL